MTAGSMNDLNIICIYFNRVKIKIFKSRNINSMVLKAFLQVWVLFSCI